MRPWRLTRRQRVEMESALAALRAEVADGYHRRNPCAATGHGWRLLCGVPIIPYDYRMTESEREAEDRIQALRVAIALRAALRADEDARCEEALDHGTSRRTSMPWDAAFVPPDHKIRVGVNLMREWPPLRWHYTTRSVPHALWEAHAEEKR